VSEVRKKGQRIGGPGFRDHREKYTGELRQVLQSDLKDRSKVIRKESCSGIPILDRTEYKLPQDAALALLLTCKLSEELNLTSVQVLVMNKIFHDRIVPLDFPTWIETLFEFDNRILQKKYIDAPQASHVYNMFEIDRRHEAEVTFVDIKETIQQHRYLLLDLVLLNPEKVSWERLVEMGLQPKTASFWLMRVRPCENVCLTGTILQWARSVPEILHPGRKLKNGPSYAPIPGSAPDGEKEYQAIEYRVRRRQRLYFPGFTSLECEGLILGSMMGVLQR
jgi:hypothetical protein